GGLVPGSALGILGGLVLGRLLVGLYGDLVRYPDLTFRMTPSLVAIALAASAAAAVTGASIAVRAAVSLPPAEAMRPPAPARYRRSGVERVGLGALLGP